MALKTINITLEESLNKFGRFVVQKMIKKLEKGGPGTSKKGSRFVGSLIGNQTKSGKKVVDTKTDSGKVELVLTLDDYAIYIDRGRGKDKRLPPVNPIKNWMKRHNLKIKDSNIWGMRKHIALKGFKGVPFLKIWAQSIKGVDKVLEERSAKEIKINIDKIIKKNNER